MTWAEHVSLIGNLHGVAVKLGHDLDLLLETAQRLQSEPQILGRMTSPEAILNRPSLTKSHDYQARRIHVRGKARDILVPSRAIRHIQIGIRNLLNAAAEEVLHDACHGYRPSRSTVSNALPHCGAQTLLKLDVHDFFSSSTPTMVCEKLIDIGFEAPAAQLLADLSTVLNALPLGSPSSPVISNLLLASFDEAIAKVAAGHDLTYTRYADDLTFSGRHDFDISQLVSSELNRHGFQLGSSKTITARRGQNLTVTGLVVWDGNSPRLPKRFRRDLHTELHYIEKHGLDEHLLTRYEWPWIDKYQDPDRHLEYSQKHLLGKVRYALGVQREWTQHLLNQHPKAERDLFGVREDGPTRRARRAAAIQELAQRIHNVGLPTPPDLPPGYMERGHADLARARVMPRAATEVATRTHDDDR